MIDPRGPRFAATLTTIVLAAALLTGSVWLLAAQAVVFALGAVRGIQHTPYSWLFRRFVRPRLAPPAEPDAAGRTGGTARRTARRGRPAERPRRRPRPAAPAATGCR